MITLTERAAKKLRQMLEKSTVYNNNSGIRFSIKAGGCSGFYYERLSVASSPHANDEIFESYNIRIFVPKFQLKYLDGTEIDYVRSVNLLEDWVFNNPNAKSTCGCGTSFELK